MKLKNSKMKNIIKVFLWKISSTYYGFHDFITDSCFMTRLLPIALRGKMFANDKVLIDHKSMWILDF